MLYSALHPSHLFQDEQMLLQVMPSQMNILDLLLGMQTSCRYRCQVPRLLRVHPEIEKDRGWTTVSGWCETLAAELASEAAADKEAASDASTVCCCVTSNSTRPLCAVAATKGRPSLLQSPGNHHTSPLSCQKQIVRQQHLCSYDSCKFPLVRHLSSILGSKLASH